MGRFFQELDYPHFDYRIATCDRMPGWEVRGPIPDLGKPYFVCVGSAQMFGRFSKDPFPEALSRALDLPVLNLGLPGSGPRVFLAENLLALINGAEFAVVQVMSANTESNSEFDNPGSDGAPGTRKSDGSRMPFNAFLAEKFSQSQQALVARIVEETRDSWVARYRELLTAITVPKILHWFSVAPPRRTDDYSDVWKLLGPFPQLVNRRMINQIVPFADTYVQTVRNAGLPQVLWKAEQPIEGVELFNGTLLNNYYPSAEMHEAALRDLLPTCKILASAVLRKTEADRETVIVAANAYEGMILMELCGPHSMSIPYRQLIEDRGLLPFLTLRKPHILHLRRRNLLAGYLADRLATRPNSKNAPSVYVDPVNFASYVHSTAIAERRIAAACKDANVSEFYFEDVVADPAAFIAKAKLFAPGCEPSREMLAVAFARVPPEQTAENRGELEYFFSRLLKSVPKLE